MKTRALFALVSMLAITACTGIKAREALQPALAPQFQHDIRPQIDYVTQEHLPAGATVASTAEKADAFQAALDSGDRLQVTLSDWLDLRDVADIGLERKMADQVYGPSVVVGFRRILLNFDSNIQRITSR